MHFTRPAAVAAFCFAAAMAIGGPVRADRSPGDISQASIPGPGVVDDTSPVWVWNGMTTITDQSFNNGGAHAGGPGTSGAITFQGTGVEVIAMAGPAVAVDGRAHRTGTLSVSVDGKSYAKTALRASDVAYGYSAAKITGLSDGNHVLQVDVSGGWCAVDSIKITGAPVAMEAPRDGDIDYTAGFVRPSNLQLNGTARIAGKVLVLTDGQQSEVSSVFTTTTVSTHSFKSHFVLQFNQAEADGVVFCLQPVKPSALGDSGGAMGFHGIARGFGLKFDIWDNNGEGLSSTGIYFNGADPSVPCIDLAHSGIILRSGHPMDVSVNYDGRNLRVTITDTVTGGTATQDYPVDIPMIIGDHAFAGFTACTGGSAATQLVLSWSLSGK